MSETAAVPSRRLGLPAAVALVMGTMIGSGVFLLPASLAPYGWNAVIAWFATIAGAMVLAVMLAKMSRFLPEAGGPVAYVRHAFGPLPSFLICFAYLVSIWTGVATIAVAAVSYLSSLLREAWQVEIATAPVAAGLIWAVTFVNMRGVRAAGQFQLATLVLKLMPLLLVVGLAAVVLARGEAAMLPFEPAQISFGAVNVAAALTLWALVGFEAACVASARVENPEVNIARATMWGTGITGILYLLVCSAVALLLPQDVAAASPAPLGTFVGTFMGPGAAAFVTGFAVISCLGAMNGLVLLQGELPRTMAVDGMLPGWFARTDTHGTSKRNLALSGALASIFVLMNSSRSTQGLFEFLLLISTSSSLWLYLACALAALKLGVARWLAVVGALYSLWTLWGAGVEASVLILVLMLAGVPLWVWARREIGARLY